MVPPTALRRQCRTLDKSLPSLHFSNMPIYEYQCSKCGRVHEIWQKISEKPLTKCPDCKGKIERLISATAFALKGSGWYKTDYERKGKKKDKEKSDKSDKSE